MTKPLSVQDEERLALNALMTRLAEGDRGALSPLYQKLWPPLHRFCTGLLGGDTEGEDVAQQALLKLMGNAASYDRDRDVLSWAFAIGAWECRSVLRRDKRRRYLLERYTKGLPLEETHELPSARLENVELRAQLAALTKLLPDAERSTVEAILAGRETPAGATWRKRKQRALQRLRALWSQSSAMQENQS